MNNGRIELVSTKKKTILLSDELKRIKSKLENNDYVFTMIEKNINEFIGNVEFKVVPNVKKVDDLVVDDVYLKLVNNVY